MGSGITNLLLSNGFETILWDINDEAIQKGLSAIRKTFAYPIKIGKMTQEELDRKIHDYLTTTTSLDDMKRADLIIEAVLEDMNIKQGIWKKLQEICLPEVTFATNTSALPITEMESAEKSRSDDRASLLQPCRADAIAGDHLRKKDIGWDIVNECGLWEGNTQSSHCGKRWSWLLCVKAAWSPDG